MQEEVAVLIENLKRWSEVSWTLIGKPDGGWVREDEQRWDGVVGMLEKGMRGISGWQDVGERESYEVLVNVFVAEK